MVDSSDADQQSVVLHMRLDLCSSTSDVAEVAAHLRALADKLDTLEVSAPAVRYPLWCVDTQSCNRSGPFDSEPEALASLVEYEDAYVKDSETRRCRRLSASELDNNILEHALESLDECITDGSMSYITPELWCNWEAVKVRAKDPDAIETSLAAWLDANLIVDAYVCEGDEDEGDGES